MSLPPRDLGSFSDEPLTAEEEAKFEFIFRQYTEQALEPGWKDTVRSFFDEQAPTVSPPVDTSSSEANVTALADWSSGRGRDGRRNNQAHRSVSTLVSSSRWYRAAPRVLSIAACIGLLAFGLAALVRVTSSTSFETADPPIITETAPTESAPASTTDDSPNSTAGPTPSGDSTSNAITATTSPPGSAPLSSGSTSNPSTPATSGPAASDATSTPTTTQPTTTESTAQVTTAVTTTTTATTISTTTTVFVLPFEFPMAAVLSRSICSVNVTCSYSLSVEYATPDGTLTLLITNGAGVDLNTIPGFSYSTSTSADSQGKATLQFSTTLDSPDQHRFTIVDVATGQQSSDTLTFTE